MRQLSSPALFTLALAALTVIRLVVAAIAPVSPDEAYYWVWSRALAPGYLDHPFMVALWVRAGTAAFGDGAFGIRVLAPLSAALGSVLIIDAARRLGAGRGYAAALLLNATLLFGAGGILMTPDTPLILFWIATLWAMARSTTSRTRPR
jgi:4-amino-4-deoxy-L-arabinose transferase-like glycosyltransferase